MVSIPSSSGHQFTGPARRGRRRRHPRFNPFFIRASVYWLAFMRYASSRLIPFQSLLHQGISLLSCAPCRASTSAPSVSIPSSSGHQFTGLTWTKPSRRKGRRFQSLLHQGISLLCVIGFIQQHGDRIVSIPSSSGHQFTAVHVGNHVYIPNGVSIPSSSGHQFTDVNPHLRTERVVQSFNPFFIRASVYWMRGTRSPTTTSCPSFNPFFIRASVYCMPIRRWKASPRFGFNPFFIRASVYCVVGLRPPHLDAQCFNPFFIRASVYCGRPRLSAWDRDHQWFQSLLHQGISLLVGHGQGMASETPAFQSLLHQGISLLSRKASREREIFRAFQSLLHQGISLLALQLGGQP